MRTLALAVLQIPPVTGDPAATWTRFAGRVRAVRASFPHVQLVVAPELLLAAEGAPWSAETAGAPRQAATTIPGPVTEALGDLARETGLWLIPGSVHEVAGERQAATPAVYNTAVVIAPDGRLAATYRKLFPWRPFETCAAGSDFVVVDLDGLGRVGLAICYDGWFPEVFRQLAWLGAEVVVQPTLTPTRDRDQELVLAQANAIVNQIYVVTVNGPGAGASLIVDPEGLVRQQAGTAEELLVDVLDLDAVARVRRFGTAGLNRPWDLISRREPAVGLPAYGGATFRAPEWAP